MPRKSRKVQKIPQVAPTIQTKNYSVAIYARLSSEDNGCENCSISNQLDIIKNYLKTHQNFTLYNSFIDNGYTGTNFDRPAFQQMLYAIKKRQVNCIVVKDISRLGRNYLEVGDYLERIFPSLAVRFIAINDRYDSDKPQDNSNLLLPLKSIMHDNYAKDISKKTATALDIRKKSGRFMLKMPPYGYLRSVDNRYQLVIDKETAPVVKQIYALRLCGLGVTSIARKLNDMAIPSQMKLRFLNGYPDGKESALWRGSSISAILTNPHYIGCIVERKGKTLLYQNNEKVLIPKENWRLIPNTHPPIIDEKTFYQVQELISLSKQKHCLTTPKNNYKKRTENLFSGLLVCGFCGGKLQRNNGYQSADNRPINHLYYCPKRYIKNNGCPMLSIKKNTVYEIVLMLTQTHISLLFDATQHKLLDAPPPINAKELTAQLNEQKFVLYERYKSNLLSKSSYTYAKEKLQDKINSLIPPLKNTQATLLNNSELSYKQSDFSNLTTLTKAFCHTLINQIVVGNGFLKIEFAFQSEY